MNRGALRGLLAALTLAILWVLLSRSSGVFFDELSPESFHAVGIQPSTVGILPRTESNLTEPSDVADASENRANGSSAQIPLDSQECLQASEKSKSKDKVRKPPGESSHGMAIATDMQWMTEVFNLSRAEVPLKCYWRYAHCSRAGSPVRGDCGRCRCDRGRT
eukprot:RCo022567